VLHPLHSIFFSGQNLNRCFLCFYFRMFSIKHSNVQIRLSFSFLFYYFIILEVRSHGESFHVPEL
jgi:hypothetical protein